MKKTQRKDAFRNIRKRIVSYLSICLVIMLGLGGVFITSYMGAGINAKATRYYNDHGFKNFELLSSLGVTDEDVSRSEILKVSPMQKVSSGRTAHLPRVTLTAMSN